MPLTKLEHFLVLTADLEATRRFYIEVLGLQDGPRPPLGFPGYWLYLGEVPCLHIAEWESYTAHSLGLGIPVTRPAPGTGPLDHLAFNGTDWTTLRERLVACGVEFGENLVPGGRLRQLFLSDPNGIKIEINVMSP